MADLGPGTMPRGKYPESPAPAGSHALISRTPPPGGMLHANLGLPRPPPRNFQPPLRRFPSRLSPRRMSGMTMFWGDCGGRCWVSLRVVAGAGGFPARWRGRFRIFSVTAGAAPDVRNDDVVFFSLEVAPVSEGDSFTRPGVVMRLRAASGEDGTRGFDFLFCGGALLPFVLRVVAGACVGRWTGQPRMPPQERLHEGLVGGLGDCFTRSGAVIRRRAVSGETARGGSMRAAGRP